ncbi:hypothetical protein DSO57_1035370 [Entomophthora muscae]|uniref:Uncharacterized protein n=1 Tax=Entomophthora muscae TaxID=34485 RepID=A0ACC2U984_9FUNG|nr:hypothetical protein DSO57_1035370 [Entomophthora muscae]
MNSAIYKYFPKVGERLHCLVCDYDYAIHAPLSTLQKHLRIKHNFSIRHPLSQEQLQKAIHDARKVRRSANPEPKPQALSYLLNPSPEPEQDAAENALVDWLLSERIPISAVTKPSFQNLISHFNCNTPLPSATRIRQLVNQRFSAVLNEEQPPPMSSSNNPASPLSSRTFPPRSPLLLPKEPPLCPLLLLLDF